MVESKRVTETVRNEGFDAVVAASFQNVRYLAGTNILTQKLIPERLALVLWPAEGEPALIVCIIEERLVRQESTIPDIRTYFEFKTSPIQTLAATIEEKGLQNGRIGIEKAYLTAQYYDELTVSLPKAHVSACDSVFERLRMTKSEEELRILERVAMATDNAIRTAFEEAHVGQTERDIANIMYRELLESGVDEVRQVLLGAGADACLIHQLPQPYSVKSGDILRVDAGALMDGYYSDLARTAVVGSATASRRQIYEALWKVHQTIIDTVRPGARVSELYEAGDRMAKQLGVFSHTRPHCGHGIGLSLHEPPMVTPLSTVNLEPGMVLCIEPIYVQGTDMYHVEDTVQVTDTGAKIMSRSTDWSQLFVIR